MTDQRRHRPATRRPRVRVNPADAPPWLGAILGRLLYARRDRRGPDGVAAGLECELAARGLPRPTQYALCAERARRKRHNH